MYNNRIIFLCLLVLLPLIQKLDAQELLAVDIRRNDTISTLLKRYQLPADKNAVDQFKKFNSIPASGSTALKSGTKYKLPVYVFPFNGNNIRTSLNVDYAVGKKIQNYNEQLHKNGVKFKSYRSDKKLWVPAYFNIKMPRQSILPRDLPYLGAGFDEIENVDDTLKGCVYYLVSGHGGPDPGAIGRYGQYKLYEDEYAYDITLRLAKRLSEHGAKVFMIVCDPNDGIRADKILTGDRDEYYYGGQAISIHKNSRLRTQAKIINSLYQKHQKTSRLQRAIIIHVDSRSKSKRIDIFYYYKSTSRQSKNLAQTIYKLIARKYAEKQPGRGYEGTLLTRNLYLLKETIPTPVYIELGNIKNNKDQERFLFENNRQALANWLYEALSNEADQK